MAVKRKFDVDTDDVAQNVRSLTSSHLSLLNIMFLQNAKQLKLIPFPNTDCDDDVVMFDAEPMFPEPHHTRLPSNVSTTSSNESNSPITGSRMFTPQLLQAHSSSNFHQQRTPHLICIHYHSSTPQALSTLTRIIILIMPLNHPTLLQ